MISQTDSRIGQMIRLFSRFRYNHVSLTLDPTLRSWVSFGRFHRDVPLFGGFIAESAERYLATGFDVRVRIFRLEITQSRYDQLQRLFCMTDQPENGLIYNFFDTLAAGLRFKVPIHNAYTCLSFACVVLNKQYITIRALDEDLRQHMIYDGSLSALTPDSGSREGVYFEKCGVIAGLWFTACQWADLSTRPLRHYRRDIVAQKLSW